jgi:hypothetical protein
MSINEVVCIVRLSEPPLHPLLIVGRSCGKIGRWNLCKKYVLYGFMPGPYIIDNRSRRRSRGIGRYHLKEML